MIYYRVNIYLSAVLLVRRLAILFINMVIEILSIGFFSGLLAITLLTLNYRISPLANLLLIGVILPLTIIQLMFYLYASGYLIHVPYLFRLNSPLNLVIYPAGYLYVKYFIQDRNKMNKIDFFHFLPAVLHFFQMLPYYTMSLEKKRVLVNEILKNGDTILEYQEGGLPPYVQFLILELQGFIYIFLMYRFIAAHKGNSSEGLVKSGKKWLYIFTTLLFIIIVALLINILFPPPAGMLKMNWLVITMMLVILMMTSYLYFQPRVLYGLPNLQAVKVAGENSSFSPIKTDHLKEYSVSGTQIHVGADFRSAPEKGAQQPETPEYNAGYIESHDKDFSYLAGYGPVIESYFREQQPFLKKGYTLSDLSSDVNIPVHHLSALFNKVYGIRFNDYLNTYRLQFLEMHLSNPEYRNFTQEGLAWHAGFSSRISFFNALKKLRNQSPAEFLSYGRKGD